MDVKGRTAIVTGAGSGINLAFAHRLLEQGCNVVIGDLSLRPEAHTLLKPYLIELPASTITDPIQKAFSAVISSDSAKAVFLKTDVSHWPSLTALFTTALKLPTPFSLPTVICPGAGIFEPPAHNFWNPPGTSESRDPPNGLGSSVSEDFPGKGRGSYLTLDINLTHPIRVTQLAISLWTKNGIVDGKEGDEVGGKLRGVVVNISSIAGQMYGPAVPLYHASKHGLTGFVRSLGYLESVAGIRVCGVAPGVIKTPLWTDHPEKLSMAGTQTSWVSPDIVARSMCDLITCPTRASLLATANTLPENKAEQPPYGKAPGDGLGGVMFEVSSDGNRVVEGFNDPGPPMKGTMLASENAMTAVNEVVWKVRSGAMGCGEFKEGGKGGFE